MDKIIELLERNGIGFETEWNCYTTASIYTVYKGVKIHLTLEKFKLLLRAIRKEKACLEFFVEECDYDVKLGNFVKNISKFICDRGCLSMIYINKKFNFWRLKDAITKVQNERIYETIN